MNEQPNGRATRRAFLTAVSTVAVAAALPATANATPSPGPIATLAAERRALLKAINNHEGTDEDASPMMDRWDEIDRELIASHAETPAEALALLQVARDDYYQFNIEDSVETDQGERLVLSAFDNVLRVLGAAGQG